VFPLDRHSCGINTILIYISKNLRTFKNQGGIPSGPYALSAFNPLSWFSTPLVVMFIDPIELSPGSVWDILCFLVVKNSGELAI